MGSTDTDLLDSIKEMEGHKNQAYWERNQLVVYLSKLYPSHFCFHPIEDASWESSWRTIICIHTPVGQMTWHIHDNEVDEFDHLAGTALPNHWDGHTTEEKYERLKRLGDISSNRGNLSYEKKKRILYEKQKGRCAYPDCNVSDILTLTLDHKMPKNVARMLGWPKELVDAIDNLQLMCRPHHDIKDAPSIETRDKLMKKYNVEK